MAGVTEDKFKKMQDEMSRFEEEIGLPIPEVSIGAMGPRVISANTYNEAQKQLAGLPPEMNLPLGLVPPPPPPIPFVPPQVRPLPSHQPTLEVSRPPLDFNGAVFRNSLPSITSIPGPPMPPAGLPPGFGLMGPMPQMMPIQSSFQPPPTTFPTQIPQTRYIPPPPSQPPVSVEQPQKPPTSVPAVLSATPMMYVANPQLEIAAIQAENLHHQSQSMNQELEDAKKMQKRNQKPLSNSTEITYASLGGGKKKDKKNKKLIRTAGGQTWEDPTLGEWEDDDFRLFCGDLGNDVTDEVLTRAFSKYASFLKARVVRDKRTNKTKGFGFVSFKDPQDFIRATKEMNGRYVGSRPIKLRKSTWKNRALDVVRKKDKEKATLINMLTGR